MIVHHCTPFSVEKNLGKAYNQCFEIVGEDDWVCLRDLDTMFLTPDAGEIVFNYAYQNHGCVLTCWTNRIHHLAKEQFCSAMQDKEMIHQLEVADGARNDCYKITPCTGPLSGFLMLLSKKTWWQIGGFDESIGLLGVDTDFYKRVRAAKIPVLRMDGLYIFHCYRLGKDIKDTTHLK
jgi:GT2 family glycosyltransferase